MIGLLTCNTELLQALYMHSPLLEVRLVDKILVSKKSLLGGVLMIVGSMILAMIQSSFFFSE
jgi:hypothetical protein